MPTTFTEPPLTYFPSGAATCVDGLFGHHARRSPAAIAVIADGRTLDYAGLDRWSDAIAAQLFEHGVGQGEAVGICGERGLSTPAMVLGILKAGAGYLYFDPASPFQRMAFMANDAGVRFALHMGSLPPKIEGTIFIRCADEHDLGMPPNLPSRSLSDLALVVYTSGSTGTPKGVELSHGAILARVRNGYPARLGDLQKSSLAVVAHVSDLLVPLVSGRTVCIVSDWAVKSLSGLADAAERHGSTRIVLVPSHLEAILSAGETLTSKLQQIDTVVVSGEPLSPSVVRSFRHLLPKAVLVNGYGASELTGLVTMAVVDDPDEISVGHAVDESRVYVLDHDLMPVESPRVGEIYVAGPQLARGYVNDPGRTAERFIAGRLVPGERLYRTGDMGRFRSDGALEVLGRNDGEVSINGHRVHVAEVDHVLRSCAGVLRSVVLQETVGGQLRLAAFVTSDGSVPLTAAGLRNGLRERLPSHMVPAIIHVVDTLPVLPSGKVDRLALDMEHASIASRRWATRANYEMDEIQATLVRICEQELGTTGIDLNDHFLELGGDSLAGMRVIAHIEESMRVSIQLDELFQQPTFGELAAFIRNRQYATGIDDESRPDTGTQIPVEPF